MNSITTYNNQQYYSPTPQGQAALANITNFNSSGNIEEDIIAANNSANDAYLLDLSPVAQSLLAAQNPGATSAASAVGFNGAIPVLANAQREQITAILDKYKNAAESNSANSGDVEDSSENKVNAAFSA